MKKLMTRISVLALIGAMTVTSMTGCGNKENGSSVAEVPETTTVTTVSEETTEAETTTTAETTATAVSEPEENDEPDYSNEDWYLEGYSDIEKIAMKEGYYAVHILYGSDEAIKAFENGSLDNIHNGYDVVWKFGADCHYYNFFGKSENGEMFTSVFKNRFDDNKVVKSDDLKRMCNEGKADATKPMFMSMRYVISSPKNVTKADRYDPFANGSTGEYKENTVCIIWQKTAGTFDGAKAFYYVSKENTAVAGEGIYEEAFAPNVCGNGYNDNDIATIGIEDTADIFSISSSGSADERIKAVKYGENAEDTAETKTEAVVTTTATTTAKAEEKAEVTAVATENPEAKPTTTLEKIVRGQ